MTVEGGVEGRGRNVDREGSGMGDKAKDREGQRGADFCARGPARGCDRR